MAVEDEHDQYCLFQCTFCIAGRNGSLVVSGSGVNSGVSTLNLPTAGSVLPRKNFRVLLAGCWASSSWRRRWSWDAIAVGGVA